MFEAYDLLKILLERIEQRNYDPMDLAGVENKLSVIAAGGTVELRSASTAAAVPAHAPEAVEAEEENPLENLTDEPPAHAEEKEPAVPQPGMMSPQPGGQPAMAKSVDSTIRVDVSRLDTLMNLVGELVLGRNRLSQISHQMNEQYDNVPISRELLETNSHIDFITTELQMAVMKTRMVPIAKVFNKIPRLIRELSKEMKKDMDLEIFGEETELDKSLIEELNDPLVHLIRNAADHGVESPDERVAKGKPARGKVIVRADHEGNHIVISIQDDGKGMDPDKLKRKAIEKGLLTEAEAAEMAVKDAYNLVFLPGFSMAQKVTNVSGRGVGMDVVRTNVQKLKGTIDIESEINVGSKFIIKLPLTLAIIQALLVEAGGEIYSIPLDSVVEVVRIQRSEVSTINKREVIRLRNMVLPLARIREVLGGRTNGEDSEWIYVVVIGLAEKRLGIVVDSMLGQREVVIKSLGEYLGSVRGIAGSTILGDGRVIMIVDVAEMMRLHSTRS
ncbi:MAG: chemotaxis protein CheA [Bacteroidetes bacterium]|nr:chemotaxis protein CheA [Bacteroidota bacterium]